MIYTTPPSNNQTATESATVAETVAETGGKPETVWTLKADVDLQSWAELGSMAKPSRADRRAKSSWKRGKK
jgi:hypothetical protein